MNTPPPNLTEEALRKALSRGWSFTADRLVYAKLGAGSHHWLAQTAAGERRFVTVHELAQPFFGVRGMHKFERLRRAFTAAAALRAAGLGFVVAPLPGVDGAVLQLVDGAFSMAVFRSWTGRFTIELRFSSTLRASAGSWSIAFSRCTGRRQRSPT